MELDFSNFWTTLLIITGIFFLALAINITVHIVWGEELPCILFNDGRLAVIDGNCSGYYNTISWFLSKGYHIDTATAAKYSTYQFETIYMTR